MNRVGKVVPPKRVILRDISLSFFPGAKIGVLGLNGSGKSTLLRIMAGVDNDYRRRGARRSPASRSASCRRSRSSIPTRTCASVVEEGVGGALAQVARFNEISDKFAEPMDDDEMNKLLEEQAKLQDAIDAAGGWELERKLEIAADALRLPPWDADDQQALRRREAPRRAVPPAAVEARHAAARRADQPPRRRIGRVARAVPRALSRHRHRGHARSLLPRQRRRLDPRARPRPRHPVAGQLLLVARAEGAAPRASRRSSRKALRKTIETRARVGARRTRRRARPRARRAWQRFEELHVAANSRSATRPTRSTFRRASASAIW